MTSIANGIELLRPQIIAAAHGFCTSLGVEMRMSRRGVPECDLPAMASEAFTIKRLIDDNPRPLTCDAILDICRRAF